MVDSGQAAFSLEGPASFEDDADRLKAHVLQSQTVLPGHLSAYLSLKHLGYIVYRPTNPYLLSMEGLDHDAAYVVFKPNSSFQKKNPTGLVGCLRCSDAEADFREGLADLSAVHDGSSQLFIKTERISCLSDLE